MINGKQEREGSLISSFNSRDTLSHVRLLPSLPKLCNLRSFQSLGGVTKAGDRI